MTAARAARNSAFKLGGMVPSGPRRIHLFFITLDKCPKSVNPKNPKALRASSGLQCLFGSMQKRRQVGISQNRA